MGFSVSPAMGAALEHVDDAVILVAPGEGAEIIHVKAAFERASGYDRRDVVGRSIEALLRPRPVVGEPHIYVMTRASGQEYVVRRKRALLEADEGEPLTIETHRDVTHERAIRESEALYRKLAERASDIISRTDSSGRCIYISSSCRDVLGYEPEELVGRHALLDLAHPDDRSTQHQVLARFVEQGKTSGSPLRRRLRRKDGSYVWLETITNIERDEQGRIVEVQSWARDITSRVLAEQALEQADASFRSLLDRMPDGVAMHRNGVSWHANAEMARMTGHAGPEEIVGRSLFEFVHPDERESLRQRLADRQRTDVRGIERRILKRDGSSRVFEITSLPVMFEGAVAFLAICHDVTERKRMEERLALAERMALVGRLASGVGHEINNPLAYMLGSLELARADLAALGPASPNEPRARLEQHFATIRDGAERVRDIVRDLKSLSAASDEGLGPVDVERTLDLAAATAAHEIRVRARLVKEYGTVPPVRAKAGRLAQVFVNLLVNAAQAIPEGAAIDNEIRIVTREERGLVVVEIHDTGTGIAPEHLPHVFEPFFTTKPNGVGTGLGLSISHNIVSALGGTLTAERSSPRGTLLRLTLPTSNEDSPRAPLAASHATTDPLRARILLVDDEPSMVRVLAQLLSQHDVTIAHSGREAIARFAGDASFDAVVCDLQMNDGTGVDVYEYLCQRVPDLARRVIFTTGGAFTQGTREFLDRCPQPVLEKPFDFAHFAALVSETARRARR